MYLCETPEDGEVVGQPAMLSVQPEVERTGAHLIMYKHH